MSLVSSLLTAIVRADGDALVLHAGERPYVVAPTGQSELASRALTLDAMRGMLGELLPAEVQTVLDEVGAVQHDLPGFTNAPAERFTVVAARGGDDIWIEIRRHRKPADVPVAVAPPPAPPGPEPEPEFRLESEPEFLPEPELMTQSEFVAQPEFTAQPDPLTQMELVVDEPIVVVEEPSFEVEDEVEDEVEFELDLSDQLDTVQEMQPVSVPEPESEPVSELEPVPEPEPTLLPEPSPMPAPAIEAAVVPEPAPEAAMPPELPVPVVAMEPEPEPVLEVEAEPMAAGVLNTAPATESWVRQSGPMDTPRLPGPPREQPSDGEPTARPALATPIEPQTAVVVPLSRNQLRSDQPVRFSQPLHIAGIDRLLRIAAVRGASTLYLTSQARPSIRVDGEISSIEGEPVLSEADVESLMLDIIPERNRETLRSQAGTEWICDVPDVGRIRCVTFRDHRGAGGIFRMIPARAISAEQLGLSREIQGLCAEADGLVLVTGPRQSGKSTLISAFVDLINRTRSDHVITLENQIKFVHENRGSLVSQREVRGDNSEWMSVARAALRENPDVLVIEDFRSPEIVTLALEAAQSGHLVIGALTAHTTTDAIDRIIDQTPPERRPKIQLGLAEALRGVVGQVLLRKTGGGRVAAREVLLNASPVANLIAEGKTSQLPMAIDSGRKHGMVPLNDALVAFVENGIVDSREAYRQAADQPGFLALLKRQGIDTTFVERLA